MHALQELGERLVALPQKKLTQLGLDEHVLAAIVQTQSIKQHEAKRRQLQYIGRLMREIDAVPIEAQLAAWARPGRQEARTHQHAEHWRERLLREDDALTQFAAQCPAADVAQLRALVTQSRWEQQQGEAKASRELYRAVNAALRKVEG